MRRRARNRCEFCGYPQVACYASFDCDHFLPRSRGGKTNLDNLVWACPTCNASKADKTHAVDPMTDETAPLFNPRTDHWAEHFEWSKSRLQIRGKTQTGRATVAALRMNRRGIRLIRRMLLEIGLHPDQ